MRDRNSALWTPAIGVAAVVVFVVCSVIVRGGPLDSGVYGDVHLYRLYGGYMQAGQWPYRDFFDEYPPLAQPLFLVVRWLPGAYTHAFRWTMVLFGVASVLLLVATLASIGASRLRIFVAAGVAAASPVIVGPIFLNAYDLWPALLTAAALLALVRNHTAMAFVLLALGGTAKVYPYAVVLLALIWAWRRSELQRALVAFVATTLVVILPFAVTGPGGLRFSYKVQATRGLEIQSLGSSVLLAVHRAEGRQYGYGDKPPGGTELIGRGADVMGTVSSIVQIAAVLFVTWLFWRRRLSLLAAFAAAILAFVAFAKVFSPQYVDWLVPVVPAAGIAESILLLPVLMLTHHVFDYQNGIHHTDVNVWWLLARNLWVVGLYVFVLVRGLVTRST